MSEKRLGWVGTGRMVSSLAKAPLAASSDVSVSDHTHQQNEERE